MNKVFGVSVSSIAVLALIGVARVDHSPDVAATTALATQVMTRGQARPNILLITTDDERLADQAYMPRTNRLIAQHGVTFQGISPNPLCCPARAELMTGQYSQNNGVRTNHGHFGGYKRYSPPNSLPVWLSSAGYRTGFLGKYLNGYDNHDTHQAEPGWDFWEPTVARVYQYFDFTVRHRGELRRVPHRYQIDYFTDRAVDVLGRFDQGAAPYFVWMSYLAPHQTCPTEGAEPFCRKPPKAARRYRHAFRHVELDSLSKPSFNEADMSDKPKMVRGHPLFDAKKIAGVEHLNTMRLRALKSVDDGVAAMIGQLRKDGALKNTIVIFTSDNGFSMGEHRYVNKILGYEEPLQVPFMMRGPSLPSGVTRKAVATSIDVAPTILSVAGATATVPIDGRNLAPLVGGKPGWDTILIQDGPLRSSAPGTGWLYRGVRTDRYTYLAYEQSGQTVLYDRRHDPYELRSVADKGRYSAVVRALVGRLRELSDCAGETCRRHFRALPRPAPR